MPEMTDAEILAALDPHATRFQRFFYTYVCKLYDAMQSHPSDYGIGESDVVQSNVGPRVAPNVLTFSDELCAQTANKMRSAFLAGSYNKDGRAIRATCRELGIKYTYKAIAEWLAVPTTWIEETEAALSDKCVTDRCINPAMTWRGDSRYCTDCATRYDIRFAY
jgi:hypothetical protein